MDVSILIRSLNAEALLTRCLTALAKQQTKLRSEIVLLDCSSDDRTREIARSFGVNIYTIPRNLFTFSSALNAGAQLCRGEFMISLSADAVPAREDWLDTLIAPLLSSPNVTASFSRQVPWEQDPIPQQQEIATEFGEAAWLRDKANFQQLLNENLEPFALLTFSNVSSCMRRDFILSHPFYELPYFEDRAFALDVLSAGTAFAYAPESVVYHSHAPHLPAALSVSERGVVSRAAINREAARRFNKPLENLFISTPRRALLEVPATFSRSALKILKTLLISRSASRRSEIAYYISQGGIALGTLRAVTAVHQDGPLALKRSDPTKLFLQARKDRT
ncbi:MAG: glycosyltransferase family 2 protein [Deltaproteobacteria bacterium]|nr:glycosyltransferase family 2 protein [Deltaproteobacteria bacterium]